MIWVYRIDACKVSEEYERKLHEETLGLVDRIWCKPFRKGIVDVYVLITDDAKKEMFDVKLISVFKQRDAKIIERYFIDLSTPVKTLQDGARLQLMKPSILSRLTSTYAIALEAWRRGIKVEFLNSRKTRIKLTSSVCSHEFEYSRIMLTTSKAIKSVNNKALTRSILSKNNIPVPQGKTFTLKGEYTRILECAKSICYPVVLKQTDGSKGEYVFANIKNDEELKAYYNIMLRNKIKNIIIEKHIGGDDYRIQIVNKRVVAGAVKRIPANITGNGTDSIKTIIMEKNKIRKQNPFLRTGLIKTDEELELNLKNQGYNLRSVPKAGEYIVLKQKANASSGGETIDVTDYLPSFIKELAIGSIKAIPDLYDGGVDILWDSGNPDDKGTVIEINGRAQIGVIHYPMVGEGKDVAKVIIDEYFPDTKGVDYLNNRLDFRFEYIQGLDLIKKGFITSFAVNPPISGKIYASKYTICGKVQGAGYRQWIKKKAVDQKLHGYANNLKNGNIELVVAGNDQEAVNQFIDICREGPKKARVDNVIVEEYLGPVKIGFHVQEKNDYDELRITLKKEINSNQICKAELKENQIKLKETTNKLRKIRREYKAIKNCRSWRYTELIRKTFSKLHGRK